MCANAAVLMIVAAVMKNRYDAGHDEDKCYCDADAESDDGVLAKVGTGTACCAV